MLPTKLMRIGIALSLTTLWGQEDTARTWKVEGLLGIQAAQTALTNWQAGGQNQISAGTQNRLSILREVRTHTFSLDYTGQYGLLRVVPQRSWRKTQDFLLVVFQYKWRLTSRWAFSILADGRTQWAPTYDYVGDSIIRPAKSAFLAPFYGQFSLGMQYKVFKQWGITISPLSGRLTYVRLGYLADAGNFGLESAQRDEQGIITKPARKALWEVGGRLTSRLEVEPIAGLSINHFLDAFHSYSARRRNPILLSQLQATYKLKSWLALTFSQQAIYDPRVEERKQALQLLTAWTLGITWRSVYPQAKES